MHDFPLSYLANLEFGWFSGFLGPKLISCSSSSSLIHLVRLCLVHLLRVCVYLNVQKFIFILGYFQAKQASIGDIYVVSDCAFHDRRIPIPVSFTWFS